MKNKFWSSIFRRKDQKQESIQPENNIESSTPPAPWIQYPNSEPTWGGWRQGESEDWLCNVWLPFWRTRTPDERNAFLSENPPPSEDWRLYMEDYWTGEALNKLKNNF